MEQDTPELGRFLSLEEIELEVEAEGREWMRRRLEERLQELADRQGVIFPPGETAAAKARAAHPHVARPAWSDGADSALRP
jgi:hypothetical protein